MTATMTSRLAGLSVLGFLTLSLLTACTPTNQAQAEAYIRANVGTLSPTSAVLGGTFTVTDIEWEDADTAIVSYEDGHIALKGRTNIEKSGDTVRVSTFALLNVDDGAMSSSAGMESSTRTRAKLGEFCGGIAGILCETGLMCRYDGNYPDAGGVCVR